MKALLISSSGYKDTGYLTHCTEWIEDFLGDKVNEEIVFIPFAGVRRSFDEYEALVKEKLGLNVKSIHRFDDMKEAIKNAKVIAIGGGNTFMLNHLMHKHGLVEEIKKAVENGAYYFGWSAGANVAGKSMKTTNDMPIVQPKTFDTIGIFPYQINPHFISGKPQGHNGESREERLEEFLIANPHDTIYALPEGVALKIDGNEAEVIGYSDALKLEYKKEIVSVKLGDKIVF